MQMELDYRFRGDLFRAWPWYFYVAGVARVSLPQRSAYRFQAEHPQHHSHAQQLLCEVPWHVPILIGPSIPCRDRDAETRAAIFLVLFKPWPGSVDMLLQNPNASNDTPFATFAEARDAYEHQLRNLDASLPVTSRPDNFSDIYWARRVLRVVRNIDNWSRPVTAANAGGENPAAASGVSDTTEVRLGPRTFLPAEPEDDLPSWSDSTEKTS